MPLRSFVPQHRDWEALHRTCAVKLWPGEYYVTSRHEVIVTVLGSCVSACIRDPGRGIGGMNHFMLPERGRGGGQEGYGGNLSAAARYGSHAMELLINTILKHGGNRTDLEVKIFGGGRILSTLTDIGQSNIAFVREYIRVEGLRLVAADVGDQCPRKILYFPATGKVWVKKLRSLHDRTIMQREKMYLRNLASKVVAGEVELF